MDKNQALPLFGERQGVFPAKRVGDVAEGHRYGKLMVLGIEPATGGAARCRVRCSCRTIKTVAIRNLLDGSTISCGCKRTTKRLQTSACAMCGVRFEHWPNKSRVYCTRPCKRAAEALPKLDSEPEIVPGCRWLPLGEQRFALVDDADFPMVSKFYWRLSPFGYVVTGACKTLHRTIAAAPVKVDHRNGVKWDNRRANLRWADNTQNSQNQGKRRGSSSFKGVSLTAEKNGLWRARITVAGKETRLGYFRNETEAAHAYDAAARDRFGEFACVNFPRDGERSALVKSVTVAGTVVLGRAS